MPESCKSEYLFSSLNGMELNNGPMRIRMPLIHLGAEGDKLDFYDLAFEMNDFGSTFKRGISIHSIELVEEKEQKQEQDVKNPYDEASKLTECCIL